MSLTIDCGEGRHEVCRGKGREHYLIPQDDDGEQFVCACRCHNDGHTMWVSRKTREGQKDCLWLYCTCGHEEEIPEATQPARIWAMEQEHRSERRDDSGTGQPFPPAHHPGSS